ncbi:MAG TPA: CHAP domain-containing protein [Dictyobacter sp.]|jgi:surface antigen|nr:CHAP domain-containing protein [Dictyobacter sp.]
MPILQKMRQYLRQYRALRVASGHVVVLTALAVVLSSSLIGSRGFGAFAAAPCASGDQTYTVQLGDTLDGIASRNGTTWQKLASYNKLGNPNLLFVYQHICIPEGNSTGTGTVTSTNMAPLSMQVSNAPVGYSNPFPWGQCTWWASQRYHQLHGVYVPWTTNANAYQWTARARQFHWHVSSKPSVGSIIVLQGGVQGAWGLGHVGVVEKVLGGGRVLTSNMDWGVYPGSVTYVQFSAAPGVSFITR